MTADLKALNTSSAKIGSFNVRVNQPHAYEYSFTSKRSSQKEMSEKIECRLVGSDEEVYVMAVAKGKRDVEEAKKKFTPDSTWTFTNIQFETNSDPAYISSALKLSVDLKKSIHKKFDDGTGTFAKFIVPPDSCRGHENYKYESD